MTIVQIQALPGYDDQLETERDHHFFVFQTAHDNETKKRAFRQFAAATQRRSETFVAALERAKGLAHE